MVVANNVCIQGASTRLAGEMKEVENRRKITPRDNRKTSLSAQDCVISSTPLPVDTTRGENRPQSRSSAAIQRTRPHVECGLFSSLHEELPRVLTSLEDGVIF